MRNFKNICANLKKIQTIFCSDLLEWMKRRLVKPRFKEFVAGKHFGSNEEVTAAVNGYCEDFSESRFRDGIWYWRNVGQSELN